MTSHVSTLLSAQTLLFFLLFVMIMNEQLSGKFQKLMKAKWNTRESRVLIKAPVSITLGIS